MWFDVKCLGEKVENVNINAAAEDLLKLIGAVPKLTSSSEDREKVLFEVAEKILCPISVDAVLENKYEKIVTKWKWIIWAWGWPALGMGNLMAEWEAVC